MPYSPYLLLKYRCHINVEVCLSVRGVKYLYKYVHKGPDRAMVGLHTTNNARNEIDRYRDMRSLGSAEGCWRTFNFGLYTRSPPVHALCLHLENGQRTYFAEGMERDALANGPPAAELLAWFAHVRSLRPEDRVATNLWYARNALISSHHPHQHGANLSPHVHVHAFVHLCACTACIQFCH